MISLDWANIGEALRESAMEAHDGYLPSVEIGYAFLLDNPDLFSDAEEWPADMPADPPEELIAAYRGDLLCPNCGRATTFRPHAAAGHEPHGEVFADEWLTCKLCGKPTDWAEVTAANTPLVDRPAGVRIEESEAIQ